MNGIPVIRIEIQGMKESISHALAAHSEVFETMTKHAVEKSFNVETIQAKIDIQVAEALDGAINSLSGNHYVKTIIHDIVVNSLVQKRDELKKESE